MTGGEDPVEVVRRLTGVAPRAVRMLGAMMLVETGDGRPAVLKAAHDQPGQAAAEAAGLRWLADAGGVPVPEVLGHDAGWLLVRYLSPVRPDADAGRRFGTALARTHAAGADAFGCPPPGGPERAWIGPAPMANVTGDDWPSWYVEHRVLPYLRLARDGGGLDAARSGEVEVAVAALLDAPECTGPAVQPARLHGDLWSGNVCWSGSSPVEGWVIDPAAHGGHPETDLAMLALFGCPQLDAILSGYQEAAGHPLDGLARRRGLHQLFPLLVHVVLFGAGYADQAVAAARSVVRLAHGLP